MAKIQLNGKKVTIRPDYSLFDLLKKYNLINKLKFPLNKIAIEKNNLIIEKKKIKRIFLKSNDKIEIVHFIGGG